MLWILPLVACSEESPPPVDSPPPAPVVEQRTATTAATTTTVATATTAEPQPAPAPAAAPQERSKAEAARSRALAKRREVAAEVTAALREIEALERRLRVTGQRNERRQLLADLGKARGRYTDAKAVARRCEQAFDGELWVEIEETWALAEDLEARGEKKAAGEAYARYTLLVPELLPACEPLPPMEGKPNRFRVR